MRYGNELQSERRATENGQVDWPGEESAKQGGTSTRIRTWKGRCTSSTGSMMSNGKESNLPGLLRRRAKEMFNNRAALIRQQPSGVNDDGRAKGEWKANRNCCKGYAN